jgi:DNA polymerase IIIc chi subunit
VLTEDELRISGGGVDARFPVADLVVASYVASPPGALRIDLVDGDHIRVLVRDEAQFMERLRRQIWEFEKSLLPHGSDVDGALDVSPTLLAEAEACMDAADARLRATGRTLEQDRVARQLVARSSVLWRRARADAVRRRRVRLRARVVAGAGQS